MKIHRLHIEGFGPFRDPQTLDIDRLAGDGLFLLAGPTGAGKSSVLDAVSYALYDSVPRYDGDVRRVRSDHSGPTDPSRVQLDFSMNGERYRITRSPEYQRPAKRGSGITTEKSQATLEHWRNETWHGLAAKPRDVAEQLAPILILTRDQFQQVILLAQNRFQRFLHAKDQERKELLRTLFRTERFEQIEQALAGRRQALAAEYAQLTALTEAGREQLETAVAAALRIAREAHALPTGGEAPEIAALSRAESPEAEPPGEGHPEGVVLSEEDFRTSQTLLESSLAVARARASEAEQLERDAEETLAARERTATSQLRRNLANQEVESLLARTEEHRVREALLAAASRAQLVVGSLDRQQRASDALSEASEQHTRALGKLAALGEQGTAHTEVTTHTETSAHTLRAAAIVVHDQLATLTPALLAEVALPDLRARLDTAAEHVESSERELHIIREAGIELPERIAVLREALSSAEREAQSLTVHQGARERAEAREQAHRRAQVLSQLLEEAQQAFTGAADAAAEANTALADLLRERQRGTAAELASTLLAGKPCPVCGAQEHPAPAVAREGTVTEEEIQAADDSRVRADTRVTEARERESEVREQLAAARAEAGPGTPEGVAADLLEAIAGVQAAQAAAHRATEHRATIQELDLQGAQLGTRAERAVAALEAARASERTLRTALQDSLTLIREARGEHPMVAERDRELRARAHALEHAIRTQQTWEAAASELREAEEALRLALEEHSFVSVQAAREAQLPAPEIQALTEQSHTYRTALARAQAVLAEPELQDLPAEPVNTEEARQIRERSRVLRGETAREVERLAHAIQQTEDALRGWRSAVTQAGERGKDLERLRMLADAVEGKEPNTRRMRLETFVLAARLEAIITAANARLSSMVHGRYALQHDDELQGRGRQSGLGIKVLDEHTGRARSADSLSGGETFLVSLSLALGLADVVTAESGGVTLDTLFIDEGFGSLDPEALEQAMATLDSLREGGRTVAVISHVTEMKEQIHARVDVRVNPDGTSQITQGS